MCECACVCVCVSENICVCMCVCRAGVGRKVQLTSSELNLSLLFLLPFNLLLTLGINKHGLVELNSILGKSTEGPIRRIGHPIQDYISMLFIFLIFYFTLEYN